MASSQSGRAKRDSTGIQLRGLRVTLDKPSIAAQQLGRCWFPALARFPTGELMASYSIMPDELLAPDTLKCSSGICFSKDGGRHWYGHAALHSAGANACVLADGSLLSIGPWPFRLEADRDKRRFRGDAIRYFNGGRDIRLEADSVTQIFPRDIRREASNVPYTFPAGDMLALNDGRLLLPFYVGFDGDSVRGDSNDVSLVIMVSCDLGRTWRYQGQVAGVGDFPHTPEGPDEAALVRLSSGELMIVYRVGMGKDWKFGQAYSPDDGRTWSPSRFMRHEFSVMPRLRLLQNGVLALSGGRPGVFLWLCTDGHGDNWQAVDIIAHHHRVMGPEHTIETGWRFPLSRVQTTAYTGLVETEPNELVLLYDRSPHGWGPVPADCREPSRIYALRIKVEGTGRRLLAVTPTPGSLRMKLAIVEPPSRTDSGKCRPASLRLNVKNIGSIRHAGKIALKLTPPGTGRIMGKTHLAQALKPGTTCRHTIRVQLTGQSTRTVVQAVEAGTNLPPVTQALFAAPVCSVCRVAPTTPLDQLPAALRRHPVLSLRGAAPAVLAEVRLARAGTALALEARVRDRKMTRGPLLWDGSCIELFGAKLDGDRIGHVYLVPQVGDLPAAGFQHVDGPPQPAQEIRVISVAVTDGYRLQALIPASLLAIDLKAGRFRVEVQGTTTLDPRGVVEHGTVFGSTTAYATAAHYGLAICR